LLQSEGKKRNTKRNVENRTKQSSDLLLGSLEVDTQTFGSLFPRLAYSSSIAGVSLTSVTSKSMACFSSRASFLISVGIASSTGDQNGREYNKRIDLNPTHLGAIFS
jgi:hypothetical protein